LPHLGDLLAGAIGSEQTSHVVGYLAVSGTRPPYAASRRRTANRNQPSFASDPRRANAAIPSPFGDRRAVRDVRDALDPSDADPLAGPWPRPVNASTYSTPRRRRPRPSPVHLDVDVVQPRHVAVRDRAVVDRRVALRPCSAAAGSGTDEQDPRRGARCFTA
jgi:hypothetical protein